MFYLFDVFSPLVNRNLKPGIYFLKYLSFIRSRYVWTHTYIGCARFGFSSPLANHFFFKLKIELRLYILFFFVYFYLGLYGDNGILPAKLVLKKGRYLLFKLERS